MAAPILIEGPRKRFGRKSVLDGVDLAIEPGAVYGLVGANGTGKTTTLKKILMNMITATVYWWTELDSEILVRRMQAEASFTTQIHLDNLSLQAFNAWPPDLRTGEWASCNHLARLTGGCAILEAVKVRLRKDEEYRFSHGLGGRR